MTKQINLEVN